MKKIFLMMVMMISITYSSMAFKIGGIEFSWKRGKPEWNATKTDVGCVGKGMCTGTIKFTGDVSLIKLTPDGSEEFDITGNNFSSNLVNFNGQLAIEFSKNYYNSFRDDFSNGMFDINGEININSTVAKTLGYNGSTKFAAGKYKVYQDKKTNTILVLLN